MTGDPIPGDASAHLRVRQHYGELLADFHRKQADIAAEQDAKLAAWQRLRDEARQDKAGPAGAAPVFDDDDFSHNTWLR